MISWAASQPIFSKSHAWLTLALAKSTSTAKRSKSSVKRPCGWAHGTFMVLTPCPGQSERGVRARINVANCIVSKCRHVRSGAQSWIEHSRPHSGHRAADPHSQSNWISTFFSAIFRSTVLTFQGLQTPKSNA